MLLAGGGGLIQGDGARGGGCRGGPGRVTGRAQHTAGPLAAGLKSGHLPPDTHSARLNVKVAAAGPRGSSLDQVLARPCPCC